MKGRPPLGRDSTLVDRLEFCPLMCSLILLTLLGAADESLAIKPSAADPRSVVVALRLAPNERPLLNARGEIDAPWGEARLRLHLVTPDGQLGTAVFASYGYDHGLLTLRPRFPLSRGKAYRAVSRGGHRDYRVPLAHASAGAAAVERIAPTAARLPANQLKFYLFFSAPMREDSRIFEQIELLDELGMPIADPWRRTELWSRDGRRLTLWIHPGRIKRGVNLREDEGPVLRPGRRYTLRVGADVRDASGRTLGRAFEKTFSTDPEDHTSILPQRWKLSAVPLGTRAPLRVEFGEPLDHELTPRCLRFVTGGDRAFPGVWRLEQAEQSATFTPVLPWAADAELVVDPILEDLAGNTPARVFDTDLQAAPSLTPQLRLKAPIAADSR